MFQVPLNLIPTGFVSARRAFSESDGYITACKLSQRRRDDLLGVFDRTWMKSCGPRPKVPLSQPEGHVDQADQCWHFYQRPHDTDERLSRVQTKDRNRYSNSQLKGVTSSCKGESGLLGIIRAKPLAHPKADQKHDEEVDDQRNSNFHHIKRQSHNEIAFQREHNQNCEEQRDQRKRTYPRNEARPIPFLPFEPNENESCEESGGKWNAEIKADALRDLADSDLDNAALKTKPLREHRKESPGVETIKKHLKDAVDSDQSGNVIRIAFRKLIPDEDHRNTTRNANQDEPTHVCRFIVQEDNGKEEHECRADEPVLYERQTKHALVA